MMTPARTLPPQGIARLGLGGSHLASLSTRPDRAGIDALLDDALAGGIRFFDTADIYGQGDSERRLARVAARQGSILCTKAGLALGVSQGLVRLAKPALRPVLLRARRGGQAAARMRQSSQRTDFSTAHLRRQLAGSLRRLRRARVELFLLHNPGLDDLADGRLLSLLSDLRAEGHAERIGVSCPDLATAAHLAATGGVDALQVPLNAETLAEAGPMLEAAAARDIWVIAREVLPPALRQSRGVAGALAPLAADPRITVVLTGTTSLDHLAGNLAAFRAALPPGAGGCI